MKNILVYPCGTDEAIEINRALGPIVHFRLFGADDERSTRGPFIYERFIGRLSPDSSDFMADLQKLCRDHHIDYIFPACPETAHRLSNRTSSLSTDLAWRSFEYSPRSRDEAELFAAGRYLVTNLTDRFGRLRFSAALRCQGGAAGLAFQGLSDSDRLADAASRLNEQLAPNGPWYFIARPDSEQSIAVMDVRPGLSPASSLYRQQGVNLAALALFDRMEHQIEVSPVPIEAKQSSVLTWRYQVQIEYENVYFDLDETLLIREQVNPLMIAFLFQCRNRGKNVYLITKHRYHLPSTLDKYRISNLFDAVYWLKPSDEKYLYIKPERSILIDDAYSERKKVSEKWGIPTFETSAVECLLDWRL